MSTVKEVPIAAVCGESILYDLWDAAVEAGDPDAFRTAFLAWAERLTAGYDAAVANGILPPTHDLSPNEDEPSSELQKGLVRGEGLDGATILAKRYGVDRTTVNRVAGEMGVRLGSRLAAQKQVAWDLYVTSGETRPRVVLAALQEAGFDVLPSKRALQVWGREFRNA